MTFWWDWVGGSVGVGLHFVRRLRRSSGDGLSCLRVKGGGLVCLIEVCKEPLSCVLGELENDFNNDCDYSEI